MSALFVIVVSYALGCLSTAYYLFRFSTGRDIRDCGSGAAGARNIGRQLGPLFFITTFLIDFTKGMLAVGLARYFNSDSAGVVTAMLAIVAGHIWPAHLGFRGGKGVAVGFGALLVFDYKLLIALIFLFGVACLVSRNFTISGLIAISLTPVIAVLFSYAPTNLAGISLLAAIILFAHRGNLREFFAVTPAGTPEGHDTRFAGRQK